MTIARPVATLVLLAALVAPATAAAHPLTAAEQHAVADLAGVPVTTLERRVNRLARELGHRPGTRVGARAAATGDPGTVGSWSGVIPAPVIPIFEALLPSGKILMWDSVGDNATETYTDQSFTRAAVYDPVTNTSKRVDVAGYNIFCAGFVQLANGNVFVAGAGRDTALTGSPPTRLPHPRTGTPAPGPRTPA